MTPERWYIAFWMVTVIVTLVAMRVVLVAPILKALAKLSGGKQ